VKKILRALLFLLSAVLLTAQLNAFAEDAKGAGKVTIVYFKAIYTKAFNQLDTNNDGVITPDEYLLKVTTYNKDVDANGDGIVTEEEDIAYKAGKGAKPASKEKKDAAKKINKNTNKPIFNQMDTDNDGVITQEEYIIYYGNLFDASDLNDDKKITAEESTAKAKDKFNKMDSNKDEKITRDEYIIYWIGAQK